MPPTKSDTTDIRKAEGWKELSWGELLQACIAGDSQQMHLGPPPHHHHHRACFLGDFSSQKAPLCGDSPQTAGVWGRQPPVWPRRAAPGKVEARKALKSSISPQICLSSEWLSDSEFMSLTPEASQSHQSHLPPFFPPPLFSPPSFPFSSSLVARPKRALEDLQRCVRDDSPSRRALEQGGTRGLL